MKQINKSAAIITALLVAIGGTTAYGVASAGFRGTVTGHVTVVTNPCPPQPSICPPPLPSSMLNITAATANGVACAKADSNQSVSCPGFEVMQRFTLSPAYTVKVCNNGTLDASVGLNATTTLGDSTVQPTFQNSPPMNATVLAGTCLTWSLDYTAGQTTGEDTVRIVVAAE